MLERSNNSVLQRWSSDSVSSAAHDVRMQPLRIGIVADDALVQRIKLDPSVCTASACSLLRFLAHCLHWYEYRLLTASRSREAQSGGCIAPRFSLLSIGMACVRWHGYGLRILPRLSGAQL